MAELVPAPFPSLLRRLVREHEREGKVFDLPARRFWRGSADLDTSVVLNGQRAASPLGPAAGPHGQMAQNILLSWLAGSRILELKTVQVDDRLEIPRPCIDVANVGYNVEWSQELRLSESLREYVAGSMLLDVAREMGLPGRPSGPGRDETILDMSVGYDLAGIRSPQVRSWIEAMKDARAQVESLRREIPDDLRRFRDLDFRTAISRQVTLSTFHGCPASEIEAVARFLLEEMDVHVTVKLNPMLLGREQADALLHDTLGYTEIQTRPEDFERDLRWEQALEITDRLSERARQLGRSFRLKLSNTLVVRNHRAVFPSQEVMYLSGPPLHVLTLSLVERFRRARPEVPLSFSAGVDARNFPDCAALGLLPITTCTDLLKPGGYGRLPRYLDNLEDRMRRLGVRCLGDYVVKACGAGEEAVRRVVDEPALQGTLVEALRAPAADLRPMMAQAGRPELYDRLVAAAAVLNTPVVVARALAEPRYHAEANRGLPRKIGSRLALFDCINCDKCLPVCPNDANFIYETHPETMEYANYRAAGGAAVAVPGGRFEIREHHQIATFQDFCNDCGNCDTFCPEDGGPYVEKPRFFGSLDAWRRWRSRDGFFVRSEGGVSSAWGRIRGVEYSVELDGERDRAVFSDGQIQLELRHRERRVVSATALPGAAEGHELDVSAYLAMSAAVDGVLDQARANAVNAGVAPRNERSIERGPFPLG